MDQSQNSAFTGPNASNQQPIVFRRQTIPARRSSNRERPQSRRSRALGLQPARHVRIVHRPKQQAGRQLLSSQARVSLPPPVESAGVIEAQPSASLNDLRRYAPPLTPRQQYHSAALPSPLGFLQQSEFRSSSFPFHGPLNSFQNIAYPLRLLFQLGGVSLRVTALSEYTLYPAIRTHRIIYRYTCLMIMAIPLILRRLS
ncbi:hypothetical protein BDP81DRAFT_69692 [Colletotrichum phormii]|uniref:Uncharacterized protein n=1 Tax=Colletotrichum phormii TaxID=359342 RepID=A0AAI9ZMJ6_9PEZI|nr:uncharacterized protein BDP81DRAFT_69692 [Colletotrichum phormii]KAK1633678.1 hypothetical protein BDP81DRAFT_69692 [Colletotrichum phormii]